MLGVFDSDPRVQIVAGIAPGSRFAAGTAELLGAAGLRTITWDEATSSRFDLAIAATHRGDLRRIRAPLILLPHGAGHNRHILTEDGRLDPLLPPPGVRPFAMAFSGEEQQRRTVVVRSNQHAGRQDDHGDPAGPAVVVGDPCFDSLLASDQRRAAYRDALGLGGRQLILVTSTWRDGSLFGRHTRLAAELVAQLPADEYAVAAVLHPNIWALHSAYQVGTWLADARRAGLTVISPGEGWQPTLVASDLVVGDHGSVTMYAAALGKPLLLASFADDEVVAGSAAAAVGAGAARLAADRPLRPQLSSARTHVGEVHDMISWPGESLTRLRHLCYDALGLPVPSSWIGPRPAGLPRAAFETEEVFAYQVFSRVDPEGVVSLERFPAALHDRWRAAPSELPLRHLAVDIREPQRELQDVAAVTAGPRSTEQTGRWDGPDHPVGPGSGGHVHAESSAAGCLITARDGRCWRMAVAGDSSPAVRAGSGTDPLLLASVAYAQLHVLGDVCGGRIRLGSRELDFSAEPVRT